MRRQGAKNRPLKCANVGRDQSPGIEWPKIPAETPYLASYRKRAVCEDWMVVCAVICEPVSDPTSGPRAPYGPARSSIGPKIASLNPPVSSTPHRRDHTDSLKEMIVRDGGFFTFFPPIKKGARKARSVPPT